MTLIRSCLSRRVRCGINQALRPPPPTPTSGFTVAMPPPPTLGAPIGSLGGLVSNRRLRVTRTPPQTPPMPPMDLRYNYAAGVFIVVLFTWAVLSPEDDGFNTLLGGGANDIDDDDDDDDDNDERYDGTGYEGRDKALVSSGGGGGEGAGANSSGAAAKRAVAR